VTSGKCGRRRIATIERGADEGAGVGIGLTLDEVKRLVERLQGIVAAEHAQEVVSANSSCGACGLELPRKGMAGIVYRTAFGKLRLSCPRLYSQCRCGARAYDSESFNPLAMVVAERTHPELLYLQTRLASVVSYERAAKLLQDVLPINAAPGSSSIKAQVRKVGAQLARREYQAGEDFFDGQPLRLPEAPREQAAHVLELDAGYVRAVADKCDGRNSFGIITTRLSKPQGPAGWNAFVIEETMSPLARLHHFLHRQGVALETPMAIISDGGEDVAYPTYLPWRPVQRILDWFHISMRFEHVLQRLRGLRNTERATADALLARVESAKWRLWHGRAADCLEQLKTVLPQTSDELKTRVAELIAYLGRNRERLVDYGTRHRSGLPISTSMAESAVESVVGDRFKKNRKMRWTPKGANALLHIRVANLNDELGNALKERHRARTRPANESTFYSWAA
jgi:hypothetical protein